MGDFKQFVAKFRFPIISICEARFPSDFRLPEYILHQSNRLGGASRAALLIRTDIPQVPLTVRGSTDSEICACRVRFGTLDFTAVSIYLQPTVTIDTIELAKAVQSLPPPYLVCGDFNAHNASWGSQKTDKRGTNITDFMETVRLLLINDGQPTYPRYESILDLAMVTDTLAKSISCKTDVETHGSDHVPLLVTIKTKTTHTEKHIVTKINWGKFRVQTEGIATRAVNLQNFTEALQDKVKESTKKFKVPAQIKMVNGEYERLRAVRRRAERRARKTKSPTDIREARRLQAKIRKNLQELSQNVWRRLCENASSTTSIRDIYRHIQQQTETPEQKHPFAALSVASGHTIEVLADDYCRMLTTSTNTCENTPPPPPPKEDQTCPLQRDFTLLELHQAIASSPAHSSPGPDKITYQMLKNLSSQALQTLLRIFNQIWRTGEIPPAWKISQIKPLLKPGKAPTSLQNFRPIALSSCLGKILDKMVQVRIQWFLENNSILPECMSGFRKNRSTTDSVIDLVTFVEQQKALGKITSAVFLDIHKAFDTITHSAILQSAIAIGIEGRLFQYIVSYLTDRHIYMNTSTDSNILFPVTRGVPQGGILSPTLFNIGMLRLPAALPKEIHVSMFADDICVCHSHPTVTGVTGPLREAVCMSEQIVRQLGMSLSAEKTVMLPFTRKSFENHRIYINGEPIAIAYSHKFLGVTIDRHLTWGMEIDSIKKKTTRFLNILHTIAGPRWGPPEKTMAQVFESFVLSNIRFSLPLLCGIAKYNQDRLDSIYTSGLRSVLGVPQFTSKSGTIEESGYPTLQALQRGEIMKIHLRHRTRHITHSLALVHITRPESKFGQVVQSLQHCIPSSCVPLQKQTMPFWLLGTPDTSITIPGITRKADSPTEAIKQHTLELLDNIKQDHKLLYTDGSTAERSSASALYDPETNTVIKHKLSHKTSSTATELHAILSAVEYIQHKPSAKWAILSDSKAAILSISNPRENNKLVYDIRSVYTKAQGSGHSIKVQWVPGHSSIMGNEKADSAAKSAHELGTTTPIPLTKQDAGALSNTVIQQKMKSTLENTEWRNKKLAELDNTHRYTGHRHLKRRDAAVIHRLRLGVAFTKAQQHKMKLTQDPLCHTCNEVEDSQHIFLHCQRYATQRKSLAESLGKLDDRPLSMGKILGSWHTHRQCVTAAKAALQFLAQCKGIDL